VKKGEKYIIMPQAIDCEILTIEDEVGNILEKASAGENCRF